MFCKNRVLCGFNGVWIIEVVVIIRLYNRWFECWIVKYDFGL